MQAVQVSEEQRLSLINTNCIQYNQNRIAIEQLEKVKSFGISAEDNGWCITHKDWLDIVEFIDNQIKQLKEIK